MSELLAQLDPQQRQAATEFGRPVVIRAGAGTGKTRAITYRIAHGVATGNYSPGSILAITFTNKAAAELKQRLAALGVPQASARTIHSAALSQIGYFWPSLTESSAPAVLPSKSGTLTEAATKNRIRLSPTVARDLAAEIEWRKVRMLSIDQYVATIESGKRTIELGIPLDQIAQMMTTYEEVKDGRRQIDFEDVLLLCTGMLADEPRVAAEVREQFRHFLVDEFQDISPLQYELIRQWLGPRKDICVVGDSAQTIYSFAGASRSFLEQFSQDFPDSVEIELRTNYRSTRAIVASANQLMRNERGAIELDSDRDGPSPQFWLTDSEAQQASRVAEAIHDRIGRGASPASIAVLYRMNSQSAALEEALSARGIALKLRGGVEFFDRPEIRQVMMALHAESISRQDANRPLVQVVADVLSSAGFTREPPEGSGALRDRWENLAVFARLADETDPSTSLPDFVSSLRYRAEAGHDPDDRAVTLSTIHAAKGLEWETVFVVGATEGVLPLAGSDLHVEEERRLFYVAITRARHELVVVHANGRQARQSIPSRFVTESGIHSSDGS